MTPERDHMKAFEVASEVASEAKGEILHQTAHQNTPLQTDAPSRFGQVRPHGMRSSNWDETQTPDMVKTRAPFW